MDKLDQEIQEHHSRTEGERLSHLAIRAAVRTAIAFSRMQHEISEVNGNKVHKVVATDVAMVEDSLS